MRSIIRISSFISKELREILRQTRLMAALVLGPFLILLIFGLGYRNEARILRALFVVPANATAVTAQVQEYATNLGPQLEFAGVVANEGEALSQLNRGQVDAVVIVPGDAQEQIRNSQQPVVRMYHREIDPIQVSYMQYVSQLYVDEVNRRVLQNIAEQGQQEAASVQDEIRSARASAAAMREAFSRGDVVTAQSNRASMNRSLDIISVAVGSSLGVLSGVEQTMGGGGDGSATAAILSTFGAINEGNQQLEQAQPDQQSYSAETERATEVEQNLEQLDTQLVDFQRIDPKVLVSPFRAEALTVNNVSLTSSDFFAPGVIVLLLQHLLVTFAALSIVRERTSGTMELFRVAPVTAFETLLGKYLSYLFIGALLAAGISALVVLVLGVPMYGNWVNFALILLALMFTSLGIGFVISLLSDTTSQSVQYSMLVLLFSIFFSGFFLDLRLMWDSIRPVAYAIPATYGLRLLQEVMFRAAALDVRLMAGLVGFGVLLFVAAWLLLRSQMRQR